MLATARISELDRQRWYGSSAPFADSARVLPKLGRVSCQSIAGDLSFAVSTEPESSAGFLPSMKERKLMRLSACVWLFFALATSPAVAGVRVDACQVIPQGAKRATCYDRESIAAKHATSDSTDQNVKDPIEQMKIEEDNLTKRLQGICRGC